MGTDTEYYFNRVGCFIQDANVGLHHKFVGDNKKPTFPGSACQDIRTLVHQSQFWAHQKNTDVYFSMGAQKEHLGFGKATQRLPTALRKSHNTIAAKCFYIDVDVDTDPKKDAYRTREAMEDGVGHFIFDSGLPQPNLIVNSGRGGWHLYWILDQSIHPNDFAPIARALSNAIIALGLKADAQCTTDICRLLRVPGTYNYKTKPPLPVTIDSRLEQNYTLEDMSVPLAQWITGDFTVQGSDELGGLENAAPEDVDNLGGGIDSPTYAPADIEMVAKECPFLRDALDTGGKDHSQTLWFYALGLACHTTDPAGVAVRVSKGYPAYNESETAAKLAECQRSRRDNTNLGPPRCEAIHRAGGKGCGACPHLLVNSTPLSFGVQGASNGGGNPSAGNGGGNTGRRDKDLPVGYYRGPGGFIHLAATAESKDTIALRHKIVPNSSYFEATHPWSIVFSTEQHGVEKTIRFPVADAMDKLSLARHMASHGVLINHQEGYKFMQSFIQYLRSLDQLVVDIPALGWHTRNGATGFAFDQHFVSAVEDTKCQRLPADQGKYGSFGEGEAWKALSEVVLTPKRPDLAVLVASGFASPLLHFTGHNGVILGAWSAGSGRAKTTALSLSQAIWGCPSGMSGLDDTLNYVMAKASALKCLPICYDEIKTPEQARNLANLIHNLTRGTEKGRLNSRGEMKPTRTWETQITFCANTSMYATVTELQKGTLAGLYRMFEYECLPNQPTTHSTGDIARMTKGLYSNYGIVGRQYAEHLGKHHDAVQKFVASEHDKYHNHFNANQEERFWTAILGTLMAGAQLANYIGVANFPIDEMEGFLVEEFTRMRHDQSKSSADFANPDTVVGELSNVLNHYRAKNTIVTDIMLLTAGKPGANAVHVLNDKMLDHKKEAVHVHISLNPLTLRISMAALGQYCKLNNIPVGNLNTGMQHALGAKSTTARLASGTTYATGTMGCWTIPLAGSPLESAVEWAQEFGKP